MGCTVEGDLLWCQKSNLYSNHYFGSSQEIWWRSSSETNIKAWSLGRTKRSYTLDTPAKLLGGKIASVLWEAPPCPGGTVGSLPEDIYDQQEFENEYRKACLRISPATLDDEMFRRIRSRYFGHYSSDDDRGVENSVSYIIAFAVATFVVYLRKKIRALDKIAEEVDPILSGTRVDCPEEKRNFVSKMSFALKHDLHKYIECGKLASLLGINSDFKDLDI